MSFSSGAGPPSVPKPPTMLEVGIRHLTLAWEAPESNGAEIMSYTLEMEDRDSVSCRVRYVLDCGVVEGRKIGFWWAPFVTC